MTMYVPMMMYVPMTMFVYNNSCLIINVIVCTDDDLCVYRSRSIPPRSPPPAEIRPERGRGSLPRQENCLNLCRGRRTFNTGSRYEPVLKGGAEGCGSPTCATL